MSFWFYRWCPSALDCAIVCAYITMYCAFFCLFLRKKHFSLKKTWILYVIMSKSGFWTCCGMNLFHSRNFHNKLQYKNAVFGIRDHEAHRCRFLDLRTALLCCPLSNLLSLCLGRWIVKILGHSAVLLFRRPYLVYYVWIVILYAVLPFAEHSLQLRKWPYHLPCEWITILNGGHSLLCLLAPFRWVRSRLAASLPCGKNFC